MGKTSEAQLKVVGLVELSKRVDLDPKVIRRLIRKQLPLLKGNYEFAEGSSNLEQVTEVCRAYKSGTGTVKPRKARSESPGDEGRESRGSLSWDEFNMVFFEGGRAWSEWAVPNPENASVRESRPVYLGREEKVKQWLKLDEAELLPGPELTDLAYCVLENYIVNKRRWRLAEAKRKVDEQEISQRKSVAKRRESRRRK